MARSLNSDFRLPISGYRYGARLTHRFRPARPGRDGVRTVARHRSGRLRRGLVGKPSGTTRPDRAPASPPASQRDAKPTATALSSHALEPSAPRSPAQPAAGDEDAAKLAALPENDKTGAVVPQVPAPPAMSQASTKLYHRVTVRDGSTLQSGKIVIRLTGIVAREANATCKGEKGKIWFLRRRGQNGVETADPRPRCQLHAAQERRAQYLRCALLRGGH
jgi:hypothetical protein